MKSTPLCIWFCLTSCVMGDDLVLPQGVEGADVAITWPATDLFRVETLIKLKASVSGMQAIKVEFYADTNLIGTVTNEPFNFIWSVAGRAGEFLGTWNIRAVAEDSSGQRVDSARLPVHFGTGLPPIPDVHIVSPRMNSMFAVQESFEIQAEQLASAGDGGPVDFFVGTNLAGRSPEFDQFTEETSYFSTTVDGLPVGAHQLRVEYGGLNGSVCDCRRRTTTIRVVNLGLDFTEYDPRFGRFEFDLVTAFPDRLTTIERTTDLMQWQAVTNVIPGTNRFRFSEMNLNAGKIWYRARIPMQ